MSKYENFVEQFFDIRNRAGDEVMVLCVHHDDNSASMQINLNDGLWLCFSCGAKGGPKQLFADQDVRWQEPEEDLQFLVKKLRDLSKKETTSHVRTYPESYLSQFDVPIDYWKKGRGIGSIGQKVFQLGYSPMGDYATIPLRSVNGELLGVIKRPFDPQAEVRYRYPFKFERKNNLYASWLVERDQSIDHVVLCEGSLDAIKVWQAGIPAMAVYGSSMSTQQIRLLRRLGINNVTLMFDDDQAGRKATKGCAGWHISKSHGQEKVTYNEALDLKREFLVNVVRWPKVPLDNFRGDNEARDPADLSSENIEYLVDNSTPLK